MDDLKKAAKRLRVEYIVFWLSAVLLFLAYETALLEEGVFAGNVQMEYILQSTGILLALGLIPLALKIFSLALVKRISLLPLAEALPSYLRWSEIRLSFFTVIVLVNLSVYYLTLSSVGGLCALIGLLASLFCWPSEKRIKEDLNLQDE